MTTQQHQDLVSINNIYLGGRGVEGRMDFIKKAVMEKALHKSAKVMVRDSVVSVHCYC